MGSPRYYPYYATILLSVALATFGWLVSPYWYLGLVVTLPLALLGTWNQVQPRHTLMRNYPLLAYVRFISEEVRPELRQYFFESNLSGTPFSREQRTLVYERAKNIEAKLPFGTELNVYDIDYRWMNHSITPTKIDPAGLRVQIGGPQCQQPYAASLLNISAMSFGALSANAIRALNAGAAKGGFAHDTGEGGISRYHREAGGDIILEVGTGYFGCRNAQGQFCPDTFARTAADPQVKMIELKLSQGAKPGHGGLLPAAKVSAEIAEARGVPMGVDCVSPPSHSTFSTPIEMMEFIGQLRTLSGGKPVGFKLCIGHRWEFMAICKAMIETGIKPDFIVVDGAEGGTGAAPIEFTDSLGTPLRQGLNFVQNVLVGANLRDDIKIGASGKIVSSFDMAVMMSLGADWCNSARGFMFAVGCVQSQSCHTNRCPVGVATQDERRQQAINHTDKSERVYHFHNNTIKALAEFVGAVGLNSPHDLQPRHIYLREGTRSILPADKALTWLEPGALLGADTYSGYSEYWAMADAKQFDPVGNALTPLQYNAPKQS